MFNMFTKLLPFLSSAKGLLVALPTLILAQGLFGWYLHSSGYHSGYEKAELVCAEQREAGKDEAITELLRLQEESLALQLQNQALNVSINNEIRKEDEVRVDRIETIIEKTPVIINDNCRRDGSFIGLHNQLAAAGLTSGDSAPGSGEGVSDGTPE